jgi:Cilia- and flagella-associated protein 54
MGYFIQQPWPRTATEKLLVSMCQGSAAQALCILEALTDSNRRILLSSAPTASDLSAESDLIDVYVELFMAAHEIIGGEKFCLFVIDTNVQFVGSNGTDVGVIVCNL